MEFSISMALVDYIPVILFAMASIILMRDLYNKMSKGAFAIFSAGVINITLAGALKATWKFLYAVGLCDFEALNKMFFPVQSIGFLLAGLGMLAMIVYKQSDTLKAVAPPLFSGTFIFVTFMVAGLGIICFVLSYIAKKLKKSYVIAIFIVAFICSMAMGYLSTKNFEKASMNWIAEVVNVVGQGALFLGTFILHKNKLVQLKLKTGEVNE